jgi:hypothetical protein
LDAELAALARPRKYYQRWFRTRAANDNMMLAPQGLRAFFRQRTFKQDQRIYTQSVNA